MLRVGDAVALARDLVPQFGEGAHLADFGDEAQPRIDEERDAPDHLKEFLLAHLAGFLHRIEHRDRGRQRVGQLLHRRRAGLLQVIRAHVHRIPLRQFAGGEDRDVLDEPHRRLGRKHVGAARQIFLDDVVLDRAGQRGARRALLVGHRDVERHQPRRGGIDGHRRIHGAERNAVEQRAHVAEMADRHADLADFAFGSAGRRCRSRSGSADRRRPKGRSAPCSDFYGKARWIPRRSNDPHRCGRSTVCRVWPRVTSAARFSVTTLCRLFCCNATEPLAPSLKLSAILLRIGGSDLAAN